MTKLAPPPVEAVESVDLKERRFVYNGGPATQSNDFMTRGNRPLKRRKRSPLKIVSLIVGVSFLIVFYVWNKIAVNQLVIDVNDLRDQRDKIQSMTEVYRSEINKKSSLERISKIAGERLNLKFASIQPIWFHVEGYDPELRSGQ